MKPIIGGADSSEVLTENTAYGYDSITIHSKNGYRAASLLDLLKYSFAKDAFCSINVFDNTLYSRTVY